MRLDQVSLVIKNKTVDQFVTQASWKSIFKFSVNRNRTWTLPQTGQNVNPNDERYDLKCLCSKIIVFTIAHLSIFWCWYSIRKMVIYQLHNSNIIVKRIVNCYKSCWSQRFRKNCVRTISAARSFYSTKSISNIRELGKPRRQRQKNVARQEV